MLFRSDKQKVIETLQLFKKRLTGEVLEAFDSRGKEFGEERFNTWRRKFSQFLNENLPGETSVLNAKLTHYVFLAHLGESAAQKFWREDGETMLAYIDSLIIDVENDEYDLRGTRDEEKPNIVLDQNVKRKDKVFIVHGHDGNTKERTARFVEKLGFTAIIIHEQANRSMTIIEKIETYSNDVGFAIVLYTPDDMGNVKSEAESGELKYRARQNVVFEQIGRAHV